MIGMHTIEEQCLKADRCLKGLRQAWPEAIRWENKETEEVKKSLNNDFLMKVAIETENTGTEILSELDSQRETLLRTSERLGNANDGLFESNRILKMMKKNVFYNKLILILIIILEVFILASMIYIKFISK